MNDTSNAASLAAGLGWVDWTVLAILGVSAFVGLLRGLVFEALSLVGWVVAYLGSQWLAPVLGPYLPIGAPGGPVNHGVALVAGFLAVFLVWAILVRLLRSLIRATPLSVIDRLLGLLFGLVRGALIVLVIASLLNMTPLAQHPAWAGSPSAKVAGLVLSALKPLLPEQASRWLPGESSPGKDSKGRPLIPAPQT